MSEVLETICISSDSLSESSSESLITGSIISYPLPGPESPSSETMHLSESDVSDSSSLSQKSSISDPLKEAMKIRSMSEIRFMRLSKETNKLRLLIDRHHAHFRKLSVTLYKLFRDTRIRSWQKRRSLKTRKKTKKYFS